MTTRDTRPDDQHEPREVVIDSHVHVWDPARVDYPWLVEAPALDRRFDVSDIDNELDAAGVVAVILVQAADHIDDTQLMLELAASNARVAGVVGWVPLLDPPAAERFLDGWASSAIVGVRHLVHRDRNPDLLADPRIDDVLAMLAERNLTFDVCAETEHLLRLVPALADRHPSLTLVIDHLAKPPIATQRLGAMGASARRCRQGDEHGGQVVGTEHRRRTGRLIGRLPAVCRPCARRVRAGAHDVRRRLAVCPARRQLVHRDLAQPTRRASTFSTVPTDTPSWPTPRNVCTGCQSRR